MQPDAAEQVKFLQNLQRLLNDGEFTATYKYALLMALADISVESGNDSGSSMTISAAEIAEKFIDYYWRQSVPYPSKTGTPDILKQNSGRQASVLRRLVEIRAAVASGRPLKLCDRHRWELARKDIARIVRNMPLWKLQTVAGTKEDFLYEDLGRGSEIELRPGVAFCFRRFHGLIADLVRGAWLRKVRAYNTHLLDDVSDLNEFLFGGERMNLSPVRPILKELQQGSCFYCAGTIRGAGEVDHFIAWSRYPVDLGHNFVLAHTGCNASKGDHLAAIEHLTHWTERNRRYGPQLQAEFAREEIPHDWATSIRIAKWAYSRDVPAGRTWVQKDELVELQPDWHRALDLFAREIGD